MLRAARNNMDFVFYRKDITLQDLCVLRVTEHGECGVYAFLRQDPNP
jgi:hypothetical protein